MAGNLVTKRIRRGGKGRREQGARTRAVGEGPDDSLEEKRVYGDVNWREAGEDVGSKGEEYCGDNPNGIA